MPTVRPLLGPADTAALRDAFAGYTVDAVQDGLGPVGQAALARGDLAGVARALAGLDDRRLATLLRLFLLGAEVTAGEASAALAPLATEAARAAGLIEVSAGAARAGYDVRPYAETLASLPGETATGEPWWVVSDFGSDVRPGALATDHVLGIGAAALTLAQATPRNPVGRALDLGTGCGVQALHLGRHADRVCGTDISARALRLAATTAALSGQDWDLRTGSLLDPVANDAFDLVVANPPFVVSDGSGGAGAFAYRDSGLVGDEVCRRLVTGVPRVLAPGGTAQLLANWIVPADGSWRERLGSWFAGSGCDAWVWQREVAEPAEYVALWLRDAGEVPGTPRWTARYDAWLDWFDASGVAAVGMGLVTMWRTGGDDPVLVVDDVPQAVEQPVGAHVATWIDRQRWLAARSDEQVLAATYRPAEHLVRTRRDLLGADGWTTEQATLRQSYGLRWEVEVDDTVAAIVAACAASAPPALALELVAASAGADAAAAAADLAAVLRDLVARGFLVPDGAG